MGVLSNVSIHDGADGTNQLRIDNLCSAMQTIDYSHHEIHSGNSFSAYADNATIDGSDLILGFKTGSDAGDQASVHIVIEWACKTSANIGLYEDAIFTLQTGSDVVIINRNRKSGNASIMLQCSSDAAWTNHNSLTKNPTIAGGSDGTLLWHSHAYASKQSGLGALGRDVSEFVLAPNTVYMIRIAEDAAANETHIGINWYEHTNM